MTRSLQCFHRPSGKVNIRVPYVITQIQSSHWPLYGILVPYRPSKNPSFFRCVLKYTTQKDEQIVISQMTTARLIKQTRNRGSKHK